MEQVTDYFARIQLGGGFGGNPGALAGDQHVNSEAILQAAVNALVV
ncbi:hypothetical protein A9K68_028560 [Mesorhizobium sp. AA22]|nr:hypothetical protein A9K68_028560 [Mesorhizobium sp. AA22]